ncbi:hypothetical protein N658DRAFT_480112 [Parathielavia hyrcaniae]|uniref:Uncharacterized protein n=1 Tax=Parathielavia hyrcaniae TaxID=113614 RepID=A0AAN6PRS5_9PEZI|nr:hypothetical protein N658DRAFT_480112 [Parathielavia hyrcaniae]
MVSLRSLVAVVGLIASPVIAAVTPAQIADALNQLTSKAKDIQPVAESITFTNSLLLITEEGPYAEIIAKYTEIVTLATSLLSRQDGTPVEAGADATLVLNSYKQFVTENYIAFEILTDKANFLVRTAFIGLRVADVLDEVEDVYITIGLTLAELVESRAEEIDRQTNTLLRALNRCISQHNRHVGTTLPGVPDDEILPPNWYM